jgi:Ca2+-binding RTX toxin-like protein
MNPINSSSSPLLNPIINLGSLALDQLEDQVAASKEIRINLAKNQSPNTPSPTRPLGLNGPSLSKPDSSNIPIDRSETFSLVTANELTVKVKTVADAPIINPELTFTTSLLPLKSNSLFSRSEPPIPKNDYHQGNQENESPDPHPEDHEIDADGFPMFDPQQLQQVTPHTPTSLTATTSLSNTFLLHSNPFATKTIYLDFNGHILPANTAWTNNYNAGNAINAPAWSMDADNTTFSDAELTRIQAIWQRVAEDFAPFNVDVTTDFRGEDYLNRSSSSDQVYGMRALISPISSYVGAYGGIAYVGVFGNVGDFYKPALIFPENLGPNGEKYVAEAVSHEVGHTLGLGHDGTSTQGYYSGQGSGATGWAPIMGVGYYQPLSQWSKGEYPDANNKEDDLSIITGTNNGFGYRSDDAGNNALTLNDLGLLGQNASNNSLTDVSQFGIIERNTDQDWFRFTTGSGAINLTIQAITQAWINNGGSFGTEYLTQPSGATNLDIWAGIYGSDGTTLIAQSNPTDLLNANFTNLFLNAGTYYVAIDGVGKGDLITGYSDYGSLGQYAIAGTIIGNGMTVTPIAGLTTTEAGGTATFTVVLNTAPTADVVITLNSSNPNEGTIDVSTLTFTTTNWNIAQQVTVTGIDDAINDGDQNYSIILNPAISTDANYNGLDPRDVSLVNINNDLPVLNITTSPQTIVEGLSNPQSVVYTVSLTGIVNNSQTVTVQYATSNGSAISGSDYTSTTGTLTFTGGVTSQNITIPIINNALNETDETFTLTLATPTQATLGSTASVTTTITDTLVTDVTTTLVSGVENLTLIGVNAINGTGNSSNNIITGNTSNNTLSGGTGIDNLIGGGGNDTYVVDTTTDVITENVGEGTDTIQSSVTFDLTTLTNIENLTLTGSSAINGTGNTVNNTLTGNSGNNILNGGAGIDILNGSSGVDTLIGGTDNDLYIVDTTTDVITENVGEGTDTIQSSVTFSLANLANIENLTLTGTGAINGTGNTSNNVITGNTGNNTLNGGDGLDALIGGLGNDIYVVDTTTDVITENVGEGTDTIQSSVTFDLSALVNIEKLTLTGTSAINGTGNAVNNTITGNTADNLLTGGDGIDTLVGGTGNDTYVVDTTTDVITESASSGTDTIQASVTFSIASLTNVENLTLAGSNDINGTGNKFNNTIVGNTADNLLAGGAGSDTLTGGFGVDRFSYKTLGDSLLGTTNNSFDIITDFNANVGNDLFLVATARSGFIDVGAIATLDATGIGAALTTTAFKANSAAQFTFTSGSTTRTFIAINNNTAGFSATADAIIELTGLTGTIGLANFTTV